MPGNNIFRGLACFSPSVTLTIKETWTKYGGKVARTAEEKQSSELFFCCGLSDHWLLNAFSYVDPRQPAGENLLPRRLSQRPIVVIHSDWILASTAASFALPLSRFVLDDRYENLKQPRVLPYDTTKDSLSQDTLVNSTIAIEDLAITSTPTSSSDQCCTRLKRPFDTSELFQDPSVTLTRNTIDPTAEYASAHPFTLATAPNTPDSVNASGFLTKRARVVKSPVKTEKKVSAHGNPFIKRFNTQPKRNTFALRLPENLWHSLILNRAPEDPYTASVHSVRQSLSHVPIGRIALLVPGNVHLEREFRCVG